MSINRYEKQSNVWGVDDSISPYNIGEDEPPMEPEKEYKASQRHVMQMRTSVVSNGLICAGIGVLIVLLSVVSGFVLYDNGNIKHVIKPHHSKQDVGNDCVNVILSSHGSNVVKFKNNGKKCDPVCYDDEIGRCSTYFDGSTTHTRCISEAANCSGLCNSSLDCPTLEIRASLLDELDYFYGSYNDFSMTSECLDGMCVWSLNPLLAYSINFPVHTSQALDDRYCQGLLAMNHTYSKSCIIGGAVYSNETDGIQILKEIKVNEKTRDGNEPHHYKFHNCKFVAECAVDRREPMKSSASGLHVPIFLKTLFFFIVNLMQIGL